MKRYFITGTGTAVGKTFVACALSVQLRAQGKKVMALKPVISGYNNMSPEETDTGQLLQAQGLPITKANIETLSPWRFEVPLSPDMAAQDEKKIIDFNTLVALCQEQRECEYLLIEGAGGVMTPLDSRHTMLDWMTALGYPVILVTGSYLGALSHTLTASHAIASLGLKLQAVVVNESSQLPVALARTASTLQHFIPAQTQLQCITRLDSLPQLWKYAPDLTSIVL